MLNIITPNIAAPLPRFLKTLFLSTFLLLYQGTTVQATNPFLDSDINEDGDADRDDALAIYNVVGYRAELEDSAEARDSLLRGLSSEDSDEGYQAAITKVDKWVENSLNDIDKDGDVDIQDAIAVYYVLAYGNTLDNPYARWALLSGRSRVNSDAGYLETIDRVRAIKTLQGESISDVNGVDGVDNDDVLLMYYVKTHTTLLEDDVAQRERYLGNLINPELSTADLYMESLEQINFYLRIKNHYQRLYETERRLVDSHHDDIKDYEYRRIIRYVKDLSASTPEAYETPEYKAQKGLGPIKASSMYARGGTGAGVTVGVMDYGASPTHPDLAGKYVSLEGGPYSGGSHGTHVAGIIAAKRNDIGMHGVAYDAKIASYSLAGSITISVIADWDIKRAVDQMRIGFGEEGEKEPVLITNNSWIISGDSPLQKDGNNTFKRTASKVQSIFRNRLSAYRDYVNAGGVQVWSAANDGKSQVSLLAGLPFYHPEGPVPDRQKYPYLYDRESGHRLKLEDLRNDPDFPDLQDGWLAVVAVNRDGSIASYSNRCGVAAEWCLAAPGDEIYTTKPVSADGSAETDGYSFLAFGGTSSATPLVAGGLAALKSMFPSLTYHQVRQRMLDSANDEGTYAPDTGKTLSSTYGHGLLDLDAASRPMNENGGNTGDTTSFAFGPSRSAAVISTSGASLTLPSAAISRYLAGRDILVLDNYQRAPFRFPLTSFARARRSAYLSLDDLSLAQPQRSWDEQGDIETVAVVGNDYQARSLSNGSWFVGKAEGERVMEGISQLVGTPLPQGNYRMSADAHGVTLGFTTGLGSFYTSAAMNGNALIPMDSPGFGIVNWSPETILTASYVPNGKAAEAFGISVASQLRRPMGLAGTGALKLSGDSIELAYRRDIVAGESYRFGVSGRFARLRSDASPMVHLDDTLLATTELDFSLRLGATMALNARLGMERPVGTSSGSMRVASNEENSQLKYNDIRINGSDFLSFDKAVLSVYYTRGQHTNFGVGVAALRDGFGETETMVGARAEISF